MRLGHFAPTSSPFRVSLGIISRSFASAAAGASDAKPAAPKMSVEEARAAWWRAVELGNADEMLEVIDEAGVDSVQDVTGRTALHIAAQKVPPLSCGYWC